MKPMTKAAFSPRTITAAVGVALALALTGCGGDKDESQKKTDEAAQTEKADDGGGMQGKAVPGESESASAPDPSKSAEPEPSKSKDLFADAPEPPRGPAMTGSRSTKRVTEQSRRHHFRPISTTCSRTSSRWTSMLSSAETI